VPTCNPLIYCGVATVPSVPTDGFDQNNIYGVNREESRSRNTGATVAIFVWATEVFRRQRPGRARKASKGLSSLFAVLFEFSQKLRRTASCTDRGPPIW